MAVAPRLPQTSHRRWGRRRRSGGFTLAELTVGSVLSVLVVGALVSIALQQIRVADRGYSSAVASRGFRKLSDLMRSESREACLMRTNTNPRTTATPPDTPCSAQSSASCPTTAGSDLRLLFPLLDTTTNVPSYEVVRYYLAGTELRRDGPVVTANGSLVPGTLNTQLVLTNVALFQPTVAADCQSVAITIQLSIPGATPLTRTLNLAAGPRLMIY